MENKHTFLFNEGRWEARGSFIDERDNRVSVTGEARITHTKKTWVNEALIRLEDSKRTGFSNRYEFEPIGGDRKSGRWKSINSAFGGFSGRLVVVGNYLVITFRSDNGDYEGFEYLEMLKENRYRNVGEIFRSEQRISSWTIQLIRVE